MVNLFKIFWQKVIHTEETDYIYDKYTLINKTETIFNGKEPISNKEIGGLKLVYDVTKHKQVIRTLFGIIHIKGEKKLFNIKKDNFVFIKPCKTNWKLPYQYKIFGKDSDPLIAVFCLINKDYCNLYEEQFDIKVLAIIKRSSDLAIKLNKQLKTFIINN